MCSKTGLYFFFGQPGLFLVFLLSKNKDFQSGVSLKMPPALSSTEKLVLSILEISKLKKKYLSFKNNKITLNNSCFKCNFKCKKDVFFVGYS